MVNSRLTIISYFNFQLFFQGASDSDSSIDELEMVLRQQQDQSQFPILQPGDQTQSPSLHPQELSQHSPAMRPTDLSQSPSPHSFTDSDILEEPELGLEDQAVKQDR